MTNVFLAIVMDAYTIANEDAKSEETLFQELYKGTLYIYLKYLGLVRKKLFQVPDEMLRAVMEEADEAMIEHLTFFQLRNRFDKYIEARPDPKGLLTEVPNGLLYEVMER